jgi:hypothetical protein
MIGLAIRAKAEVESEQMEKTFQFEGSLFPLDRRVSVAAASVGRLSPDQE